MEQMLCATNHTLRKLSFMELKQVWFSTFCMKSTDVLNQNLKEKSCQKQHISLELNFLWLKILKTANFILNEEKMILLFQTHVALITAVERDRFTACDKMPTAFNQNSQLILLKVFVIFKSVYGFVFRDFEDFIKQISVTQLFLRRILHILNACVNWTLANQICFQSNFNFLEKNTNSTKQNTSRKKITVCFDQGKIYSDEVINAEFMFTWKEWKKKTNN